MIPEYKRHLCLGAAAVVFGILLSVKPKHIWIILSALLVWACICFLKRCKKRKEAVAVGIFLTAMAITAFLRCEYQTQQYQKIIGQFPSGKEVQVSGIVYQKEIKENTILYYLKNSYYEYNKKIFYCGKILLYASDDYVPIGAGLFASGKGELFGAARNEGNFDSANYYRTQNITLRIFADDCREVKEAGIPIPEWLYRLRKQMLSVYQKELGERDAGVLCTMVLGSRGLLDEETKLLYQSAGISHILAVSGLHISILGLGLYRFLRRIKCSYLFSAIISSITVICFAAMSGFGVSAKRAVVMYLFLVGADIFGRTYDPPNALAAAAMVILLQNPFVLFQSGFLFSFAAMIAIFLMVSMLPKPEDGENQTDSDGSRKDFAWEKLKQNLERTCLVNAGIQLWLMPLTAYFYYEVPVYSLLLNLIVIPLCGWLLGFAIFGGVLGMIFPLLSKWLLVPCHFILEFYEFSMCITDHLPGNHLLTGQSSVWILFFYYLLLSALALHYYFSGKYIEDKKIFRNKSNLFGVFGKKNILKIGLIAILFVLCLHTPQKNKFRVDFLDVGQGDGICISGENGYHIFLDGGSTSEGEVGTYRILPFLKYHRISQIDAWIVTHGDEDHTSGLIEILESGYSVKYLVLAESMPRDVAWEKLIRAAETAETEVVYVSAGEGLYLGEDIKMKCVYPSTGDIAEDRNGLSQVWSLQTDNISFLFTGDIGEDQENLLLERELIQEVDILKAAHHGSKNSTGEMFLDKAAPEITVISCGENNRYGHPHEETLERLKNVGSEICQTKDVGQITVQEKSEEMVVRFPCK